MVEKFRDEFDEAIEKGVPGFTTTNGHAAGAGRRAQAKGRVAREEAEHLTAAGRSR